MTCRLVKPQRRLDTLKKDLTIKRQLIGCNTTGKTETYRFCQCHIVRTLDSNQPTDSNNHVGLLNPKEGLVRWKKT